MNQFTFRYQLDEYLPARQTLIYSLQWFLLSVPYIVILGALAANHDYANAPALQLMYLQKSFWVVGITLFVQVLWGHRLPLVVGPAGVLLSGILANQAAGASGAVYFAIAICGLILAILSSLKLLRYVSALFTTRIVGIVLLLIAFVIAPAVLNMIVGNTDRPFTNLMFAVFMLVALLLGQRWLPDMLKSTIIVWALPLGSIVYYSLFAGAWPEWPQTLPTTGEWNMAAYSFTFDPVVIISFAFCFLALMANDLGSIQSNGALLEVSDLEQRTNVGMLITGLGNVLAGCFGVIGPVNYSLSGGVIITTGCASRFPLVFTALAMVAVGFVPALIGLLSCVPPVVIGSVFLFALCPQVAGGLMMLGKSLETSGFDTGIIIGASLMLGTMVAFLPGPVVAAIPAVIRPLVTNGFVVGVTIALFLEHIVYAKSR